METITKPVDQIEKVLAEATKKLVDAWTNNRCLECPLAELAATMAAALKFYQENKGR